jgi:endonuclease YncB( thermonuclease family)
MMRRRFLAVVVFALATPADAQMPPGSSAMMMRPDCSKTMGELPKAWGGQAYAVSGDSLSGVGLKPRLRLWGIRAPAMVPENSAAMRARAALEDMLVSAQHHVSCRMTGWDPSCQAVAQCTVTAEWPTGSKAGAHDLALRMAEDGFAYGSDLGAVPEWDKDAGEKVAHFEALARQARKGLWPVWLGEAKKE